MSDHAVAIIILSFWALSIVLVLYVARRMQQDAVKQAEDKIKLSEDAIEKTVNSDSIEQLIDLNNKDRKS